MEWVAFPFSRGSSQPRDQTEVSHIAADSLLSEPPGKSSLGERNSKGLGKAQSGRQNFQEDIPEDLIEKVTFEGDFPGGPVVKALRF